MYVFIRFAVISAPSGRDFSWALLRPPFSLAHWYVRKQVHQYAFPEGLQFLISKWYTRRELSQRMALLSCGSLLSNAFGSLIASGILDAMEGVRGYAAWRLVLQPTARLLQLTLFSSQRFS